MNFAPLPAAKILFTIEESAARLSMSVPAVRKMIRQGRLSPLPNFRHIRLSENELQRFASNGEAVFTPENRPEEREPVGDAAVKRIDIKSALKAFKAEKSVSIEDYYELVRRGLIKCVGSKPDDVAAVEKQQLEKALRNLQSISNSIFNIKSERSAKPKKGGRVPLVFDGTATRLKFKHDGKQKVTKAIDLAKSFNNPFPTTGRFVVALTAKNSKESLLALEHSSNKTKHFEPMSGFGEVVCNKKSSTYHVNLPACAKQFIRLRMLPNGANKPRGYGSISLQVMF